MVAQIDMFERYWNSMSPKILQMSPVLHMWRDIHVPSMKKKSAGKTLVGWHKRSDSLVMVTWPADDPQLPNPVPITKSQNWPPTKEKLKLDYFDAKIIAQWEKKQPKLGKRSADCCLTDGRIRKCDCDFTECKIPSSRHSYIFLFLSVRNSLWELPWIVAFVPTSLWAWKD